MASLRCCNHRAVFWRNSTSLLQTGTRRAHLQHPVIYTPHRGDNFRLFHAGLSVRVVKPYLLADIGEGITECQIIQWFIQPGARVQQFDPICEVQSDKASVEITSRYDGVITKLHYEADDMAKVGKPLVDIDVEGEEGPGESTETTVSAPPVSDQPAPTIPSSSTVPPAPEPVPKPGKYATLATPAVRHLIKELKVDISAVQGTGKDGRVLKEDVLKFVAARDATAASTATTPPASEPSPAAQGGSDRVVPLSPIQRQMFKTMTKSLSIPHFLYSDTVDFTSLSKIRKSLAAVDRTKITPLPFILKAISLGLQKYPSLNAHLETSDVDKPVLTIKGSHNIGIAVDTPSGLVVPVVRNVQDHSILSLSAEITRLSSLAREGKLTTADLSGRTITVSNIGSIGGLTVAPVIVSPQVAIVGIGKARTVPAFERDENGEIVDTARVVARQESVFSWCADHRVVDGAMMARFAEEVKAYLEKAERMLVALR